MFSQSLYRKLASAASFSVPLAAMKLLINLVSFEVTPSRPSCLWKMIVEEN